MAKPRPKRRFLLEEDLKPGQSTPGSAMEQFYRETATTRLSAQADTPDVATSEGREGLVIPLSAQADNGGSHGSTHLFQYEGPTVHLPVHEIDADPDQPRKLFDPGKLDELAHSIRENGLQQPIVVRPQGERYLIVAGERRWRAHKLLGRTTIEAKIRRLDAAKAFELALIENIAREDLVAVDEARAYARLLEMLGVRQADLARRLGVDRRRISEKLSLLRLPDAVHEILSAQADAFTEKHAVVLAQAPEGTDVIRLARRCADQRWTVIKLREALDGTKEPPAPELTLFQNVRLHVNQRGGFSLVVRARSRDEVDATIRELEAQITTLKQTFRELSAQADNSSAGSAENGGTA